jgi:NAD dependent epimerase/dehydratase family enzyme
MGEALHRPTVTFLPRPLLEKGFGDLSQVLLNSLRVVPSKLIAEGFEFRDRNADEVIAAALRA